MPYTQVMKSLITPKALKLLLGQELGLSQRGLAKVLDIDERTVRRYISGELKMPRVFQIAVSCLLDHDDDHRDGCIGLSDNQEVK